MSDPFAPLSGAAPSGATPPQGQRQIVRPIPADAPPTPINRLGAPTAKWEYHDAGGALLGFVHRYDHDGEKEFRPLTLWRDAATGDLAWRWQSWPTPRPLYGLDRLAANPAAAVVVTEGEKACDAAQRLLPPGFVAVTSPNGSKSAKQADWSPLAGRRVILWPDADAAGLEYSHAVAKLLTPIATAPKLISPSDGCSTGWDAADAEAEGWTTDQVAVMLERAAPFGSDNDDAGDDDQKGRRRRRETRGDALLAALAGIDLWHDADYAAYASIENRGHVEHWPLKSSAFKRWLASVAFANSGQVPSSSVLDDVIRTLEARAINECPRHAPYMRVGRHGDHLFLDLCDDDWRAVEVTSQGWQVVARPPVKFIRTAGMRPLPEPQPGESVETLRGLVNVRGDDDFRLVVAFLVASLRDRGPYPVLVVNGEQGTGKSVFSRMVHDLIDPNVAPIRAAPKDDRDLIVSAMNARVLAFDNLSAVPNWLSDALCRVATGGGFATRTLHTDLEETICQVQNPVMLNGIPSLTDRADLADRALNIHLSVIPPDERRPEDMLIAEYIERRPFILGALLDAVSAALRNIATVKLDRLPRMADFVKWLTAAESGLGWEAGEFAAAYERNRIAVAEGAFEADAVAVAIRDFMFSSSDRTWIGTPTELLARLTERAPDAIKKSRAWPATAQGLGNRIERAAPLLRAKGFVIGRKHSEQRLITIVVPPDAVLPDAPAGDDVVPV